MCADLTDRRGDTGSVRGRSEGRISTGLYPEQFNKILQFNSILAEARRCPLNLRNTFI